MLELKLYTNPQSRGRTVEWVIAETGLDVDINYIEFGAKDYLKINPLGKFPALQYGNQIIIETLAICLFLAELAPDKKLIPQDLSLKAKFYKYLFFIPTLEYAMLEGALAIKVPEPARKAIGYGSLAKVLAFLKTELTEVEYLCGEFSLVDILMTNYLTMGINKFKTVENNAIFAKYIGNITQRAAYITTLEKLNKLSGS